MSLLRCAFSIASPGGYKGKLSILIFHRVLTDPDPLFPGEIDRVQFDRICRWLRDWFVVLPLETAYGRLVDGTLPARALSITFDDGYRDNAEVALPILRENGLTATFFIATGYLEDGCMWNDKIIEGVRRTVCDSLNMGKITDDAVEELDLSSIESRRRAVVALIKKIKYLPAVRRSQIADKILCELRVMAPTDLMLTRDQVQKMHLAGMTIGAHTITHPILANCIESDVAAELRGSRDTLEGLVQSDVRLLAYPNGAPGDDVTHRETRLAAEAGFLLAVSTQWGFTTRASDRFLLPRFTPWDKGRAKFGWRLIQNLSREN